MEPVAAQVTPANFVILLILICASSLSPFASIMAFGLFNICYIDCTFRLFEKLFYIVYKILIRLYLGTH